MARKPINIHPGEILAEEFIKDPVLKLTVYKLAAATGLPTSRLYEITSGRRGITADTAIRLAKALRTTPTFWLNLQAEYDLREAQHAGKGAYKAIKALVPA